MASFEPPDDLLPITDPQVQRIMMQVFVDMCLPGRYLESDAFLTYLYVHVAEVVSDLLNCWSGQPSVDEAWPVPPPLPPEPQREGHRTADPSDSDDARLLAELAAVGPKLEPLPLPPQVPGWPSLQPYRTTGQQGDEQRSVGPRPSH